MSFATNLVTIRQHRNLTQTQLGQALNPPALQRTISHYERGRQRPPMQRLINLSEVLGVPVGALVSDAPWEAPEGEMVPA